MGSDIVTPHYHGMRSLILSAIIALASCSQSPAQEATRPGEYLVVVESIYDGDTFRINLEGLPDELNPVKIRVRGVDSPERGSPRCDAERLGAEQARRFAEQMIGGSVIITNLKWDKYGGRIDADVLVGRERSNFAELLIRNGHGRFYDGGPRQGWC